MARGNGQGTFNFTSFQAVTFSKVFAAALVSLVNVP